VAPSPATDAQRFSTAWIREVAARYEYQDDTAVTRAGARAARQGFYSRDDFLEVVRWKSARSIRLARRNSSADIAEATCAALDPVDEKARMTWLTSLRGVAVPVGSALLHFALPDRYPILDYRALASLGDHQRVPSTASGSGWTTSPAARISPAMQACL
jgi:hypothetical protein